MLRSQLAWPLDLTEGSSDAVWGKGAVDVSSSKLKGPWGVHMWPFDSLTLRKHCWRQQGTSQEGPPGLAHCRCSPIGQGPPLPQSPAGALPGARSRLPITPSSSIKGPRSDPQRLSQPGPCIRGAPYLLEVLRHLGAQWGRPRDLSSGTDRETRSKRPNPPLALPNVLTGRGRLLVWATVSWRAQPGRSAFWEAGYLSTCDVTPGAWFPVR